MADTTRVTFAYPYTDADGKDHKAGSTASLDFFEARQVLNEGKARVAEPEKKDGK